MSFETIRIHNDYPIIDNKVRVNDTELSEIEALAAYDGSEIIELFNGRDKQEIFRLAPIIPGNPGPSEWFALISDSIGVKQVIAIEAETNEDNVLILSNSNSAWKCPSNYIAGTFSIEGWGNGANGASAGGGGGAYSRLNAGSFDPTPNESYNYNTFSGSDADFRDSPNDNSQVLLAKSGSSINGGLASECIGDVKYSGGNGHVTGGGGSSAGTNNDGVDGGASSGGVAPIGGGNGGDKGPFGDAGIAGQVPGGGGGAYGVRASSFAVGTQGSASVLLTVLDASQFIAGMAITINGINTTAINSINYGLNQITLNTARTWTNNAAIVQTISSGGSGAEGQLILRWLGIPVDVAIPIAASYDPEGGGLVVQFSRPVTITLDANATAWVVNPDDDPNNLLGDSYSEQINEDTIRITCSTNASSDGSRTVSYDGNDSLLDDLNRHVPAFSNFSYE